MLRLDTVDGAAGRGGHAPRARSTTRASPSVASGSSLRGTARRRRARRAIRSAFPTDEHRLAYWLNAYNAFTLHAIIGGVPDHLGVEDARRAVLPAPPPRRGRPRRQPRRHRARDPARRVRRAAHPLRDQLRLQRLPGRCGPSAYVGDRPARNTARRHRAVPRQRVELPRRPRAPGASSSRASSRCTREDFAGAHGSTQEYRLGVLRFVAQHLDVPFEQIADYEVVYNVYDWGLNDAGAPPHLGPILFHEPVEHYAEGDAELRELHLYEGNFCNRTCSWCTIDGSPDGWYQPYAPAVLDQALRSVAADGNVKFYGGEPTLHADGDHRRHALPARARLPRPVHHLLQRRQGGQADRDPGQRPAQRGGAELLDLPRPRRRAAAGARHGAPGGLGARPPESPLPGLQGALPRRRRRRAATSTATARPTSTASAAAACAASRCSPRRAASTPARSPPRWTRRTTTSAASARPPGGGRPTTAPSAAGSTTCSTRPRARAASASCEMCHKHLAELPVPEFER